MLNNLVLVMCALSALALTYMGAANLEDAPLLPLLFVYSGGVFTMVTVHLIGE
jgi:hypothetical protein